MSTERKENITIDKDRISTVLVTETVRTDTEFFADLQEARNKKTLETNINTLLGTYSAIIASTMLSSGLVGVLNFESLVQRGLGFLLISGGSIALNSTFIFLRRTYRAQRQLDIVRNKIKS